MPRYWCSIRLGSLDDAGRPPADGPPLAAGTVTVGRGLPVVGPRALRREVERLLAPLGPPGTRVRLTRGSQLPGETLWPVGWWRVDWGLLGGPELWALVLPLGRPAGRGTRPEPQRSPAGLGA